jgi:hypothetical protein
MATMDDLLEVLNRDSYRNISAVTSRADYIAVNLLAVALIKAYDVALNVVGHSFGGGG